MSWWGTVVGGAFGYLLGGPLGAVLGAALGRQFDRGLVGISDDANFARGDTERVQTAFFTATFSVMGFLAKVDGRVSEDEIGLARSVMDQMQLNADQKQAAIHLFNAGKQSDFPLHDALDQFRRECRGRRNLLQMFLEILIATAMADGKMDPREYDNLRIISVGVGFSETMLEQIVAMVEAQQHFASDAGNRSGGYRTASASKATSADAYAVLGVAPSASDAEIKKAYRRLMSQHHPDKLVSKGLPEEMMELAKQKTQEIRAAYEQIKKQRKF